MCANQALSADLLRSSENIFDGRLDAEIWFLAQVRSTKIIVFLESRVTGKIFTIFVVVF